MQIMIKNVDIEGKKFYVIELDKSDLEKITNEGAREYCEKNPYGTIDHELVDENGKLKRSITYMDMRLNQTMGKAIEYRRDEFIIDRLTKGVEDDIERMKIVYNYFQSKRSEN